MLRAEHLSKAFGGLSALKEVSFEVQEGEILGLIGPNGAGKTTLFNVISGFYHPDKGHVFYRGKSISHLRPYDICHHGIARTFQVTKPFGNLTVLQNVMVGQFLRTTNSREASKAAMRAVEFIGLARQYDKPARSLTVSDRKRLEVARALATHPGLLLLDEVMAGVNPTELTEMLDMVRKIRETGVTVLLIEHIMAAIMTVSDRIMVLHHGEKIAEGSPKDVARNKQVVDAYLGEEYLLA